MKKIYLLLCLLITIIIFIPSSYAKYTSSISRTLGLNINSPQYTVTFDANGGNVSIPSKTVTYGHNYGDLPIPTKEGYVFKGWNGKNLSTNNWRQGDWQGESVNSIVRVSTDDKIFIPSGQTVTFSYDSGFYQTFQWSAALLDTPNATTYDRSISWNMMNSNTYIYTAPKDTYIAVVWHKRDNSSISYTELDDIKFQVEYGNIATEYEPYYVTNTTNVTHTSNHTLTAIWEEENATFIDGASLNAKMKQLAGDTSATAEYFNTNINTITRSSTINDIYKTDEYKVSTDNSSSPIYMWYENNTIYWYTETEKIYFNPNSSYLFSKLSGLTSINNLSDINTSKVTSMAYMFYNCSSLTTLDVSHFDTSNVIDMGNMFDICRSITQIIGLENFNTSKTTSMAWMFASCLYLTTVDVSSFDTSKVINMPGMFAYMSSLQTLDLSNFDTSSVTNIGGLFYNDIALTTVYVSDKFILNNNVQDNSYHYTDGDRYIFGNASNLVGGAGTIYDANNIDKTYAHIDGGIYNPGYFSVKGKSYYTITNLIQNGSFEDSFNNWTKTNYVNQTSQIHEINTNYKKFGNKSVSRIATAANSTNYIYQNVNLVLNHKYYYFIYGMSTSIDEQIIRNDISGRSAYSGYDFAVNNSIWKKGSHLFTSQYTETSPAAVNFLATSDVTYIDGVGLIDLTETFGEGNEPNKDWCDENIEYFDGTSYCYK